MKKFVPTLLAVSALVFAGLYAWAQQNPPDQPAETGIERMLEGREQSLTGEQSKKALQEKSGEEEAQRISLELRNINIVDVLKILSQTGGINIVAGPSVRGNTTIFLEDVNVWDALRIILEINALAYIQDGEILKVMTEKEYEDIYGVPFHDNTLTRVFNLKNARAEDVNRALTSIKSKVGKLIIDERTNSLIAIDTIDVMKSIERVVVELDTIVTTRVFQLRYTTPDVIEQIAKDIITKKGMIQTDPLTNKIIITDTVESLGFIEKVIEEYDQKPYTETRTYYLKYAKYEDIEPKVKDLLTKEVGIAITDKRTNSLVITDYPDKINDILEVIESLDTIHKQVLIDCKIVNVILDDDFAMGIDFEQLVAPGDTVAGIEQQFGAVTGEGQAFPVPGPITDITANSTGSGTGAVLTLGRVDDFRAVFRFLKQYGTTKLLSEPRITVMNNEEAQIQVGTDEPFVTSSNTVNASTNTVAEDIQFIDVGVLLSVTPTINEHNYVTMKIKPEVSQVSRTLITSQSNQIPVVQTSELETTVMVKDSTTIVLGGLIRESQDVSTSRIPVLGSIPLLGTFFRSMKNGTRQEELLVFLTPRIISGLQDMLEPKHSRSFSREFLHNIERKEINDENNYEQFIKEEFLETEADKIKNNAEHLKYEREKKNPGTKNSKRFFGVF